MRLIGISCAWGCDDWMLPFLSNATKFVDELWLAVSCSHPAFMAIEDNTQKTAEDFATHCPNLKLFKTPNITNPNVVFEGVRCGVLNGMVQAASPEKGDVVMIIDSDELYDDCGIRGVRDFLHNTQFDLGLVNGLNFCINMNHYVISPSMPRLFRVTDPKWKFQQTQRPVPPLKNKTMVSVMYHYQMLFNPAYKKLHWPLSQVYNPKPGKIKKAWFEQIYMNWDVAHEEIWKEKNNTLTGHLGFWHNSDFIEETNGGLISFTGLHPEEIEKSHLRKIGDFRTAYPIKEKQQC